MRCHNTGASVDGISVPSGGRFLVISHPYSHIYFESLCSPKSGNAEKLLQNQICYLRGKIVNQIFFWMDHVLQSVLQAAEMTTGPYQRCDMLVQKQSCGFMMMCFIFSICMVHLQQKSFQSEMYPAALCTHCGNERVRSGSTGQLRKQEREKKITPTPTHTYTYTYAKRRNKIKWTVCSSLYSWGFNYRATQRD